MLISVCTRSYEESKLEAIGTLVDTADCAKRVVFGISFQNKFDNYFLVFVPAPAGDRAGTKTEKVGLYQHGRVLVQKLNNNCQTNCQNKIRRRHVFRNRL